MAQQGTPIWHFCLKLFVLFPEGSFEKNGVEIGASLSAPFDRDQTDLFQFGDIANHRAQAAAHIFGKALLARKALIHLPGIFQQHGIRELRTNRDMFAFENEIGHAGPAPLRGNVCASQAQVAVSKNSGFTNSLHIPPV